MKIREIGKLLKESFGDNCTISLPNPEAEIKILLTDSRNHFNAQDTLFFAIRTPGGNDGHRYVQELYNKGVRNFIVIDKDIADNFPDANVISLPDPIKALTIIGSSHRHRTKHIVAITGSRGKTTLKEMIFQLMEPHLNISRSPRSFNSKIGVPLSLWQIAPDTDLAIIEAGISRKGEMRPLSEAIDPDTVIITNIGDAHSEGFASMEEKAREKASLAFSPNVRRVFYPANHPLLEEALKDLPQTVERIKFEPYFNSIDTGSLKPYELENLGAAVAFMSAEGIDDDEIKRRIKQLHRINTRLNVSEGINGCSVIMDSYTSDLPSLLPALDFMARRKMPSQSMTLILSDLHHDDKGNIPEILKETGISRLIGIGEKLLSDSKTKTYPANSRFYSTTEEFLKEMSASDFNDEIILLKGAPDFDFERIHERLEAKKHETVLEVNLDALLRNYNYFRSKIPSSTGIIAMVKASGYGAGSYEIAKTLQDAGAAYLAVAALDEGIDLRKNGISMPIMVMNPRSANYRALFKYRLEPVIYSLSMLKELIEEAPKYGIDDYPVHIKLDTGMHRMGFMEEELPELKKLLNESPNIRVASVFSHLATADCLDMDEFTLRQLQRFEQMSGMISAQCTVQSAQCIENREQCLEQVNICTMHYAPCTPKRHILNSAGILRFPEYHYDYVRLGIGLYGANTLPPEIEKPLSVVSTLRSVIICVREIEGEEAVGYGRNGKISGKAKIATIPVGYADGMNRRFGNGAIKVMVNGRKAPTIGNICMDATMIDVTGIDCKEGDSVEIFGENMPVQDLADTLGTIPYEILTSVSPRVKRVYYRE